MNTRQHIQLAQFNRTRKDIRERRINRETMRVKIARACFIHASRLVSNGKVLKVQKCS